MAIDPGIKYLTPINIDTRVKKYCRFRKARIKYVDYKDPDFLIKFVNEQGKILPRRVTGTSAKYQRKVAPVSYTHLYHLCLLLIEFDFLISICLKKHLYVNNQNTMIHFYELE